jgi:two-component system, NtrC family, response regulator HydG
MVGRILIVDDERLTRATLELQLADENYEVSTAANGFEALVALEQQTFDIVITDLRMPSMDGLDFLRVARERWPELAVVFITAFGTVNTAVQAMREGAADYLTKPLCTEDLSIRVRRLVERRREQDEIRRLRQRATEQRRAGGLVYRSSAMAALVERSLSVADSGAAVLVTGETGTGKSVVAHLIHDESSRKAAPFVQVNCAELNANLIESELFGHEAGAFTGALRQRHGRFEAASGGTLFIDEVDDLPGEIQVRLLRFLQDKSFERVGSNKTQHADVRVVCATKRSLPALVESGLFREDLYYRINTIGIHIPPLRERPADILLLAEHFAEQFSSSGQAVELPLETQALLLAHPWPGNVRELEHAMEHAVTFARGSDILPRHLPPQVVPAPERPIVSLHLEGREQVPFERAMAECERDLIDWALAQTGGNQVQAAKLLGLSRTTLRGRLAGLQR